MDNPIIHFDPDGRQAVALYYHEAILAAAAGQTANRPTHYPSLPSIQDVKNALGGIAASLKATLIGGLLGVPIPAQVLHSEDGSNSKVDQKSEGEKKGDSEKKGSIYKVPGSETKSGKPYIGRHKGPNPQKNRRSNDGRNRKEAEVIDHYDPKDTDEGRYKEQKALDDQGGVDNTDNKRREVNPEKQKEYEKKYGS